MSRHETARKLLTTYLEQLRDEGETELYLSPETVALVKNEAVGEATVAAAAEPKGPAPKPTATSREPKRSSEPPEPEVVVVPPILGTKKSPDMFAAPCPIESCETLDDVAKIASTCTRCGLAAGRTKVVFGVGDPHARLMFIGEAPGHDEDLQGIPFVGRAGQLLDKILDAAGIPRSEVYITNIVKSRPPNNRTPMTNEIEACWPYLVKQLELIRPKVICTLGLPATSTLLGLKGAMASLRGKIYQSGDLKVIPTYHPAAALRDPSYKRPIWEDFQILKREYERGEAKTT